MRMWEFFFGVGSAATKSGIVPLTAADALL